MPATLSPFRLSRIFAQGWNAARSDAAAANPYAAEPEKSRWNEGYRGGLEQPHGGMKSPPRRNPK